MGMLQLIEQSAELIPSDIINNVLENMILPKIQCEVDQWDPLTDIVPINLWIHPWLPFLSMLKVQYQVDNPFYLTLHQLCALIIGQQV